MIAVNLSSYGRYRDGALEHLASIGIGYVEIPVPPPDKVSQITEELNRYGLRASTLMASLDLKSATVAEEMEPQFQVAQSLQVPILFASVHAGELGKEKAYERLRQIGERADAYGITLALETHPDLCTNADEMLETMEGVHHPRIRINFDTANIYFYNQGRDSVTELRKVAPFVVSVHLKDTNGGYRTWYFPGLGEGVVNFPEIFRILSERGFFGPYTMEIEGIEGESLTREQVYDRVARSVDYLRKIGVF
ncbi:MAG: sugar phosphate isomerase/epimerase [Armatimonadetes bacterium]|nr:sugar phosphate isomerase/epimerase [Armatimonadota bacterium]MDW8120874.1 sugar phosphate isomerase/epimerase family protein [Armatimonadota bacterium]